MTNTHLTLTERIVKKDRLIVVSGLFLITLLAWVFIVTGAGTGMNTLAMTSLKFPPEVPMVEFHIDWTLSYAASMLLMWWVMMIAMMIPSASPMILLYALVVRKTRADAAGSQNINSSEAGRGAAVPTINFAGGYLFAWLIFSVVAVLLQWLFEYSGLLHGMKMWSINSIFSGLLLMIAGIYQLSPLKAACLYNCRSPVEFISSHWRPGPGGAFRMGVDHGLYCIGCCWSLMALLFVGGAMNLIWIAGLGVLVLIEKTFPLPQLMVRLSAAALLTWGLLMLISSTL